MTPLRQRMLDALELRGMAVRTQESYIDAVARSGPALQAQSRRAQRRGGAGLSPAPAARAPALALHGQPVRLRVPVPVRHRARIGRRGVPHPAGHRAAAAARDPLARGDRAAVCRDHPTRAAHLPDAGLRHGPAPVGAVHLRVADIDSHADRMCIRVVQGKGGKDRYVPLEQDVLDVLRAWWHSAHPRRWLFASRDGSQPISDASRQKWYQAARAAQASPSAGASTRCATAMPLTCWRPARTCTACRSGWATAMSAPPRATCIWPGPTCPMAPGAIR
jgi:integrase/recombinase XerD